MKFGNFLRTHILKKIRERLLPYFYYNSHHHCHHHCFHYHCKMHLYRLRTLRIPLDCNPLSVSAKFCLLSFGIYFSLLLFQAFRFLRFLFISMVIYTSLFTLTCLYLFTPTYLYLCSLYSIM